MPKLRVSRKAYTRKDGTRVKATTYKIKDRGARGRTPKAKRWFEPSVETGWEADMPMIKRRRLALRAHKGNELATARGLLALSNVQKRINPVVSRKARSDADYFFARHKKTRR